MNALPTLFAATPTAKLKRPPILAASSEEKQPLSSIASKQLFHFSALASSTCMVMSFFGHSALTDAPRTTI